MNVIKIYSSNKLNFLKHKFWPLFSSNNLINTMVEKLVEISSNKIFGGQQKVYKHNSKELGCEMNFAIYLPSAAKDKKLPVIYWLSGLTSNEIKFIQKAGAQRFAASANVIIVCPDTSPRGLHIPDSDSEDFGVGAGFYVNATQEPWAKNYRMYSYVTSEMINLIATNFPVILGKQSIMGFSMGGHGALICALKNPGLYKSISAFAPACNPTKTPRGQSICKCYFGPAETGNWNEWDATELVKTYNGPPTELLIDQGISDKYYEEKHLLPENLMKSCKESNIPAILKMREGYDHSYYYVATFIEEHIQYHMRHLEV